MAAAAATLGAVTTEADDPAALAAFWAELIGGTISGSTEGSVSSRGADRAVTVRASIWI